MERRELKHRSYLIHASSIEITKLNHVRQGYLKIISGKHRSSGTTNTIYVPIHQEAFQIEPAEQPTI